MRKLVVLVVVATLVLLLAMPAYGQSGCEIAHECGTTEHLPPGSPNVPAIIAYDYLSGQYRSIGQYGLAAFCYNYDGYWYMGEDGVEYFNYC